MGFKIKFGGGGNSWDSKPRQPTIDEMAAKRDARIAAEKAAAQAAAIAAAQAEAARVAEVERIRVENEKKAQAEAKAKADQEQAGLILRRKRGAPNRNVMTGPLGLNTTANMVRKTLGGM